MAPKCRAIRTRITYTHGRAYCLPYMAYATIATASCARLPCCHTIEAKCGHLHDRRVLPIGRSVTIYAPHPWLALAVIHDHLITEPTKKPQSSWSDLSYYFILLSMWPNAKQPTTIATIPITMSATQLPCLCYHDTLKSSYETPHTPTIPVTSNRSFPTIVNSIHPPMQGA